MDLVYPGNSQGDREGVRHLKDIRGIPLANDHEVRPRIEDGRSLRRIHRHLPQTEARGLGLARLVPGG